MSNPVKLSFMIYQKDLEFAIKWLFKTQNKENFGWSWIRDISPNEQNTAEVVYATSLFSNILSENQKLLINEAVKNWLLLPQKHAVITIDWVWVGLALDKYCENYDAFHPDFQKTYIENDISTCVGTILSLQNADGGWGDYKDDNSTVFRTSLSILFLEKQRVSNDQRIEEAIRKGIDWLLKLQNDDGGFGNVPYTSMNKHYLSYFKDVAPDIIENQYLSSVSATSYAMIALSCSNRYRYHREIKKAACFLKSVDNSAGYEIFFEVGVRRGALFTFRHFGAAWMGIALLYSQQSDFSSNEIVSLIKHFLRLQDPINGGFRCDMSSEVYTWSNSNVIMFFRMIIDEIENIRGLDYTDIIVDYILSQQSTGR